MCPMAMKEYRGDEFQAEYSNLGFELPPYDPAGMLIDLTASGAYSGTMPIINSTSDECRRFIARGHESKP